MPSNDVMKEAITAHIKFQLGCYFSGSKEINGALLVWSERITDAGWNYATNITAENNDINELIEEIKRFYESKGRQPAVYHTPFTTPKEFKDIVGGMGFKGNYTDTWMFYEKDTPKVTMPEGFRICQAKTDDDKKTFVTLFIQAYGGTTPDEPYGKLPPSYSQSLEESFTRPDEGKTTIHYICLINGQPAGIATLIYSGKYGCIYNTGTAPNHRKKGVCSLLMKNCAKEARGKGVEHIFIQTEKGSYNEKLYKTLGFKGAFIGEALVLGL